MNYKRADGETENGYIYRICSNKDAIGTWDDVSQILNTELGHNWTESAYRKKYQMGKTYMAENEDKIFEDDSYVEKLRKEREELQRERYKLQTEKLEYNKWLREHARDDLFEEKMINSIMEVLGTMPAITPIELHHSDRCGVLCLADQHYGKEFTIHGMSGDIINEYSPEIFEERMEKLLGEVIEYCRKENMEYIKILSLGDCLDGLIRNSQIWSLRWSVTDSAVKFADYMAAWLRTLSEHVAIEYYSTYGNHTELRLLDGRKNEHLCDNMEKIVDKIIEVYNKDNPNFVIANNQSGYILAEVVGYNIMGIHGEAKNFVKAMQEYENIYNVKIDYLVHGHLHHTSFDNCGVRRGVIGVGSIMGSDDFSMRIRTAADSTATMLIFERDKGKTDEHTFVLN